MRVVLASLAIAAASCSPANGDARARPAAVTGRVLDEAHIMTPTAVQRVERRLAALESATSDQVGVVTVPSLGGQAIEAYSLARAKRWKLGQRNVDNGVMLLVAPTEREVRIEVGTGLEGLLTDARAAGIVTHMLPAFRTGDFEAGIERGILEIEQRLRSDRRRPQPKPAPLKEAA
jgi:uncharacterized protein